MNRPASAASPIAADTATTPIPRVRLLPEMLAVVALYALSAVGLAWIFPAGGIWPLVFVALVPWTVATLRTTRAWLAHWFSFIVGTGFFLATLRWLMPVTDLGYAALAAYLAIYWTLAAWGIRTARRHHVSVIWSLPVVWVACEWLRATVMTGFPWLFLSHALYEQTYLIQISDLTGAYGVTFLAAMINGVLAEWCLWRWPVPSGPALGRQRVAGTIVAISLLAFTLAYGWTRVAQVDFQRDPSTHGPRVAVIQDDFVLSSTGPNEHAFVVLARYLALAAQAAQARPDLIAFPETVWAAPQNIDFVERERATVDTEHADIWWWGERCHVAVSAFARGDYRTVNAVIAQLEGQLRRARGPDFALPRLPGDVGPPVNVLVGSLSYELLPEATYPKVKKFNSALFYDADGVQRRIRYDKRHLVPFGEVVPFRQAHFLGIDLHYWLYRPLNKLSPFSDGGRREYSLWPGDAYNLFDLTVRDKTYHFGTPICYESTTPYIARHMTWAGGRRRAAFLVNISNDGWFLHSHELPQHLAANVFRAIENRVGICRAVNTGISAFIDPDGRIYSRVLDDQGRSVVFGQRGVVGYDIQPLYIDWRTSLYGRLGDWFAGACVLLATLLWLSGIFERWILAIQHRIAAFVRRRRAA